MSTDSLGKLPRDGLVYGLLGLVALGLFVIRLTGQPDLMDSDQERPAAYVLDVAVNGHWLCQRDVTGDITSKPPLYTWLAALATIPCGRISRGTLVLPSALAILGMGWLIYWAGRTRFGWSAGLLGALAFLLSGVCLKQVALARTDPLFALTVTAAALAAFAAWRRGRGWTWFWLLAAAATLTKGPLGLVLAAAGLLAAWWESCRFGKEAKSRDGSSTLDPGKVEAAWPVRGSQVAGILLFLLITVGWFALAYAATGRPLIDKMISKELVGHMAAGDGGSPAGGQHWLKPLLYFLLRFVPWSAVACVGFWRVAARPAPADEERRFERFLFCWFWIGLVIFSFPRHQRGDLLFPLLPAAALLAGRELARWLGAVRPVVLLRSAVIAAVVLLGFLTFYERWFASRNPFVARSVGIQELARSVAAQVGDEFPLTHVDDPFALQFYLNTVRPVVSFARAAELLRGEAAAFVVVRDYDRLQASLGPSGPPLQELARWPVAGAPYVRLVSNHPRLEWSERLAFWYGPLLVRLEGVKLRRVRGDELVVELRDQGGGITVRNDADQPQQVRVRVRGGAREKVEQRVLGPHEVFHVFVPLHQQSQGPVRPGEGAVLSRGLHLSHVGICGRAGGGVGDPALPTTMPVGGRARWPSAPLLRRTQCPS